VNNSSFFSANRMTHIKIVVVALAASIAVIMVTVAASIPSTDSLTARVQTGAPVVKASRSVTITSRDVNPIR
jgi:hypothetical protein